MNKIISIWLQRMDNATHIAFGRFTLTAILAYAIISEKFSQAVAMLRAAFDKENEVYLRVTTTFATKKVEEADGERDKTFRRLRNNIREVMEFGEGEQKQTAQYLMKIIEDYGGSKIPTFKLDAETGVLTNLYEDLQLKFADKVELLGLTQRVEEAKAANDEFIRVLAERTHEYAGFEKNAMVDARASFDKAYRYFVDSVNVQAEIDTEGLLTPFIKYFNAELERLRIVIGQGVSNPDWGDKVPLPDVEQKPETSNPDETKPEQKPEDSENGENNDNNNENTEGGENNGSNNGENNGEGGDNGDNGTTNPDDPWYNPDDEPD